MSDPKPPEGKNIIDRNPRISTAVAAVLGVAGTVIAALAALGADISAVCP